MQPIKGLHTDNDPRAQPEGTYRDARNAALDPELGVLKREQGPEHLRDITGYDVLGDIVLDDGDIILFLDGSPDTIARWDPDTDTYTSIVSDSDLSDSLNLSSSIQATYRRLSNDEIVIYWTDGVNPPRLLNIDASLPPSAQRMNIFPILDTVVDLEVTRINSFGGSLKGGAYQFAFAYVAEDGSRTNYFQTSKPIYITGVNGTGASSEETTSKSIQFQLSGLDTDYPEIQIAAIKGSQVTLLPKVPINDSGEVYYLFTGNEDGRDGSLDEIIIDSASYETAEAMTQQEGTLYMGNLTRKDRIDLQNYVNNIKVEAVTRKPSALVDQGDDNIFQEAENVHKFKGYKRGEVYALYLSFLLKDGTETEAFHIPGRPSNVTGGGGSASPYEAAISVNGPAPSPADGAASGSIQGTAIEDDATPAEAYAILFVDAPTGNTSFDLNLYDDTGSLLLTETLTVTAGTSPTDMATAARDALNSNGTFSGDWTATTRTGPNGSEEYLYITAKASGSAWNGYDLRLENIVNENFNYYNIEGTTSGGQDATASAPDHTISMDWVGQSISVDVTTLSRPMSKGDVADEYVTALNNNATFSAAFTATKNNVTGECDIVADQNGSDYNATIDVNETSSGNDLYDEVLQGGFDGAGGDTLSLHIKLYSQGTEVSVTGIATGATAQTVADSIKTALDGAGLTGWTITQDTTTITIVDDNDRDLDGESPAIRSGFNFPISLSTYTGGGSSAGKATATFEFTGAAPSGSVGPATGTIEAPAGGVSVDGDYAEGGVFSIASDVTASVNFNMVLYDASDQVVSTMGASATAGTSRSDLLTDLVSIFNADSSASANWTASHNGSTFTITADNVGSAYNGYYMRIESMSDSNAFSWYSGQYTSGGQDASGTYGDHEIEVTWDDGNTSTTVTVSLTGGDTQVQIAGKYATALNGDTAFSNSFTATDNGDGTVSISSTTNSSTYNGSVSITDTVASSIVDYAQLSGGFGSGDTYSYEFKPHPNADRVTVTGVNPGDSASDMTTQLFNVVSSAPEYNGKVSFALKSGVIHMTEETQDDSINGSTATIPVFDASFSYSAGQWSGGGIPTTGGSGDDTAPLSSNHPLAGIEDYSNLKAFHVNSVPDPIYNMGYWENENESYPNTSRWDIKDDTGSVTGSLQGMPVRHHRIPETKHAPHWDEANDEMEIIGLKLHDVHIPSELDDEVVGYRLYYAQKSASDQLILDQSTAIQGWLDNSTNERHLQQANSVFTDDIWCSHGWPYNTKFGNESGTTTWDIQDDFVQLHPFTALKSGIPLSGATHVKLIGNIGYKTNETCREPWTSFTPKGEVRAVKGIAYVKQNQRDVNLQRLGFSRDYDNAFGESKVVCELESGLPTKENYVMDICQLRKDVHRPFNNQLLISTGHTEPISNSTSEVIQGGDIVIAPWYYKVNTLLALANEDLGTASGGTVNEWWNEDVQDNAPGFHTDGRFLEDVHWILFGTDIDTEERSGVAQAARELIGGESGIDNLPLAWGQLWYDLIESRDHPYFRTEGDEKTETFYPASDEWVANPDVNEIPRTLANNSADKQDEAYNETKWIFQFHAEEDNWLEYNEEYSALADTKVPTIYQEGAIYPTSFPTRVVRSAESSDGQRSQWRRFLDQDKYDLPMSRGAVKNIVPMQSNILIHTTETLFRTRGAQEIAVGDERAFLGSGDVFDPPPQEILALDEGFGGLEDHREAINTRNGYVFVDRSSGSIFRFTGEIQELSSRGNRTHFRDRIKEGNNYRIGVDPHSQRLFVTDLTDNWTYSYWIPGQRWVSRHDITTEYYITTRDNCYILEAEALYRLSTGDFGSYPSGYKPFEIEYIQSTPRPDGEIVMSLIMDVKVYDNGNRIPWDTMDQVRIWNSYQDTNLIPVRPILQENRMSQSNGNARLTDQVWKMNQIRDESNIPSHVPIEDQNRYRDRLSDNIHRVKLIYNTDDREIELFSSQLLTRVSQR